MPQSLEYIHPCVTPTHFTFFPKSSANFLQKHRRGKTGVTSFLCFNKIPSPPCKFLPLFFPFFIGFPFVIFPFPVFDSFVFLLTFSVLGVFLSSLQPFSCSKVLPMFLSWVSVRKVIGGWWGFQLTYTSIKDMGIPCSLCLL